MVYFVLLGLGFVNLDCYLRVLCVAFFRFVLGVSLCWSLLLRFLVFVIMVAVWCLGFVS